MKKKKNLNLHEKEQLDFNTEMAQMYHFLPKEEPNGNFTTEKYNTKNVNNSVDELNSTMWKTEERVSEFEDRSIKIIEYEQQSVN